MRERVVLWKIHQFYESDLYLLFVPQLRSKRFSSGAPEVPIPQAQKDINSRSLALFNVF